MKKFLSYLPNGVVAASLALSLSACVADSPFDTDGMGTVQLHTVVNSLTTRSADDAGASDYQQYLRDNCVVYVSDASGLVYKEVGLDNVSPSLSLKTGNYVAEAWSGDSVTASYDKMFFRGYQPFDVSKGAVTNVVVNCQIRNVVVSVNTATIDSSLIQDYEVVIGNSRGSLPLDKSNADSDKVYLMMPDGDNTVDYSVTIKRTDGETFTQTGKIENAEFAHHYILNFSYDSLSVTGNSSGYVVFEINVVDEDISSSSVVLPSAPSISGVDFVAESQLIYTDENDIPEELVLEICGFGNGLGGIAIDSSSDFSFGESASSYQKNLVLDVNVLKAGGDYPDNYQHAGISWTNPKYNATTDVTTAHLSFSKDFIKNLEARDSQHVINVKATDSYGRSTILPLCIARSENAIVYADPIVMMAVDTNANPMAVTATKASIPYVLGEDSNYDGIPGVEYRVLGSDGEWSFVAVSSSAASAPRFSSTRASDSNTITITGLTDGTTYQYRGACGDFHSDEIYSFTTESKFSLLEASFEDWSTYSASTMLGTKTVSLPSATGDKLTAFWGSGNEGAATANLTLTDKSTDMVHSGTYSAKLESNAAMGIIAAGNLFIGYYDKTDGTNGVLQLGREYNGSHPTKVRVYANYRPASGVTVKSGNEGYIDDMVSGGTDQGQIYIALVEGTYEVRTNPDDQRLFDKDDSQVLAYGQVTWKDNFGPDGGLQMLEIPFEYNERAKTTRPTHVVIVCSASKFGDYFSGAKGSAMYVDDFELVYE